MLLEHTITRNRFPMDYLLICSGLEETSKKYLPFKISESLSKREIPKPTSHSFNLTYFSYLVCGDADPAVKGKPFDVQRDHFDLVAAMISLELRGDNEVSLARQPNPQANN